MALESLFEWVGNNGPLFGLASFGILSLAAFYLEYYYISRGNFKKNLGREEKCYLGEIARKKKYSRRI